MGRSRLFKYIYIEITGCGAATTLSLLNAAAVDMAALSGSWNTLTANLTPYIGCSAQLVLEFSSDALTEELGIDNIIFTEGCRAGSATPIVCHTIGTTTLSETEVCLNDPFDVNVAGLTNMDIAGNTDQNYGIAFVAFPAATATPYVGGTLLGTVPFANLTAGNAEASITAATLGMTGTFQVYAILSPTPLDGSCRPFSVSSINVNGCQSVCDASTSVGTSFETIVAQNLGGSCFFTDPDLTMHTLANMIPACGSITVQYEGFGDVLGFENVFTPSTNGTLGFSDGDAFRVANNTSLMFNVGQNASDGSQAFLMEDIDGDVAMYFDEVSLTGTSGSMFSMDYILSTTTWAGADFINIHLDITGCGAATSIELVNMSGAPMLGGAGAWNTLSQDLTAYIGCTAQLVIEFSSDAASEELAIDNIVFTEGCIVFPIVCPTIGQTTVSATMASLMNASIGTAGNYEIYALLSPSPSNPTCSPSAMTSILIESLPTVTLDVFGSYCTNNPTVQITPYEASPAGGVFSGSGVTDDENGMTFTFDPTTSGTGFVAITYTFTDANGCTNSDFNDNVFVSDPTPASFTALADICIDAGVQTNLSGGMPVQSEGDVGLYTGPGVTYDGNGETYSFDPAAAASKLMQNEPNPFTKTTNIGFYLAKPGTATLTITDVAGKVIRVINYTYSSGSHMISLTKSDLDVSGVFYYTLESGSFIETKRMILID